MNFEEIEKLAKIVMEANKTHQPQFIIEKNGKAGIIVCPFKTNQDKEILLQKMRKYIQIQKPDKYFFISEAWMKTVNKEFRLEKPISQYSDKQECLLITEYTPFPSEKTVALPFERKNGQIIWKEKTDFVGGTSRFNFYKEDITGEVIKYENN